METYLNGKLAIEQEGLIWKAFLTDDTDCSETGRTAEQAIGKLIRFRQTSVLLSLGWKPEPMVMYGQE